MSHREFENVCFEEWEILTTTLEKNRPERGHSSPQSQSVKFVTNHVTKKTTGSGD